MPACMILFVSTLYIGSVADVDCRQRNVGTSGSNGSIEKASDAVHVERQTRWAIPTSTVDASQTLCCYITTHAHDQAERSRVEGTVSQTLRWHRHRARWHEAHGKPEARCPGIELGQAYAVTSILTYRNYSFTSHTRKMSQNDVGSYVGIYSPSWFESSPAGSTILCSMLSRPKKSHKQNDRTTATEIPEIRILMFVWSLGASVP